MRRDMVNLGNFQDKANSVVWNCLFKRNWGQPDKFIFLLHYNYVLSVTTEVICN